MANKKKKITGKPNKVVSNPSISRANSNTDCTVTAKWKVGSALTSTKSSHRATKLDIEWTVKMLDANGKEVVRSKRINKKPIGTTTASFNPRDFVDSTKAARHWTENDFWPKGKYRIVSVSYVVYGRNSEGAAKKGAGKTYTFGTPNAPTVSALEHDMESGEIFFEIDAYDGSKTTAPRIRTYWEAVIVDTRKTGNDRKQTKHGTFTSSSKTWDEDTPEADKVVIDVTDRYMLAPNQYVKVTVTAWSESVRAKKSASKSIVVGYPNAASIDNVSVDKLEGGTPDLSGRVTAGITVGASGNKPTTNVMLQKLRSTTATTPQQASAMGEDWADTDIVDDGECDGLSIAVAELMPTRGLHSWIRVKSWNAHDVFFTYSAPEEVKDLYVDPATASDNLHLLSLTSGDDGTSLIAHFAWTQGHDPDTGTEVSWSKDEHAWESTRKPETFDTTRNDGPETIDEVEYAGTLLIHIPELEQGETYHVRGRRYLDSEESDRAYGGYTEDLTAKPVSSPTSVVLLAPQAIARGSDLALSWTFDSEAAQTEWYLLYGTEYTVVDPETGERDYTIGEDTWLASGKDAYGACVVKWSDLETRLDENGEIGLALRMGTGGSLVTSDSVFLRVVAPPVLSTSVPATITAQQFQVVLTCNVPADVTVIMRAGSYGEDGMTGGNGGDGLVHRDQTAGDVVWQEYLTPTWGTDGSSYAVAFLAPPDLELLDGGNYTLFAQPIDPETGLYGDTVVTPHVVSWANQAPHMAYEDDVAPVVLEPSDTTDADGNRVRQCTIRLAPPEGALGTETYNVYRVTPDGAYLIADRCGLTETIIDPYAPYGGTENAYRVAIVTVDGDVDWIDYEYEMAGRDLRIDFGDEYVELPYNLSVSDTYEKDFEARRKLDGSVDGYWNDGTMRTGGFSTDLIRVTEQSKAAAIRRLGQYSGPVFVRVPDGCAYQADVQVSSIGGARRDAALAVQLDVTEVRLTDEFRALLPDRADEEQEEP